MKRHLTYLFSMTLLLAIAVPFLLPVKNGHPLLDWHAIATAKPTLPSTSLGPALSANPTADHGPTLTPQPHREPTSVFRWKDENQHWAFSQTPPADGRHYETILVDPDNNLISAPLLSDSPTTAFSTTDLSSPNPYDPAQLAQILQVARTAAAQINTRHELLETELNSAETGR